MALPRLSGLLAAALLTVGGLVGGVVPAQADGVPPSSTLTAVHASITAGTAPSFDVRLRNLPTGTRTYLQRRYGSAHRWTNVVRVLHNTQTVAAATLRRGHFVFRLHTTRRRSTVLNSATRSVYSYGTVPLEAICRAAATDNARCFGTPQSVPIDDLNTFRYDVQLYESDYPAFATNIAVAATSCRSLTVSFAFSEFDEENTLYLRVVQGSRVQRAQVVEGAVGHRTFAVTGGGFTLGSAADESDTGFGALTGTASCWTADGTR